MGFFDDASLVMIPSGVKESKLYSIKPSNGDGDFTFTRGTDTATRVNSAGNIEKETQNLLTYSNTFSNSDWTKYGGVTLTSGQSGYDGSSDAWKLTKPASGFTGIGQAITISGVITLSVYVKSNTHSKFTLRLIGTPDVSVIFDLSNGTIFGGTASNWIDRKIESIGDGWYKCSLTLNNSGTTNAVIYPDQITNTTAGSIFIQAAQLEQSLVARTYIETTTAAVYAGITDNLPRLDYSGGASCPSLLLEPQRTNLAVLSEYFEGWSNKVNITATSNYTTSPEGVQNATRLQFTANGFSYNINAPAQVNGAQHTLSCYAKRNDSGTQSFGFFTNGSGSVDSAMSLTSEWQRFTYTYTATNASQLGLAGLSGADVSVFGFQVEASASYATSYIPTYGTSATRAKDVCNNAGDSATFNTNEGVLFGEVRALDSSVGTNRKIMLGDGSFSNGVEFSFQTSNDSMQFIIRSGGSISMSFTTTAFDITTYNKFAISYKNNEGKIFVNGSQLSTTDTSVTTPTSITQLDMQFSTGFNFEGDVKQLAVFNSALTDSELATLTTL